MSYVSPQLKKKKKEREYNLNFGFDEFQPRDRLEKTELE